MEFQEEMPGIMFQALARARHQSMLAELARCGLQDLGQPMILFLLKGRGRDGEIPAQRELADALRVSPATIAVSLKSLEREGYVEKRADAKDQRRKAVLLTAKGDAALLKCHDVFRAMDQRMFEGFSPEETELLTAFHMRMLRNLRGEAPGERKGCQC